MSERDHSNCDTVNSSTLITNEEYMRIFPESRRAWNLTARLKELRERPVTGGSSGSRG